MFHTNNKHYFKYFYRTFLERICYINVFNQTGNNIEPEITLDKNEK